VLLQDPQTRLTHALTTLQWMWTVLTRMHPLRHPGSPQQPQLQLLLTWMA
jgi:hypothetical protein